MMQFYEFKKLKSDNFFFLVSVTVKVIRLKKFFHIKTSDYANKKKKHLYNDIVNETNPNLTWEF